METNNDDRAGWGLLAAKAVSDATGCGRHKGEFSVAPEVARESIGDAMANLGHAAQMVGLNPLTMYKGAIETFLDEVAEAEAGVGEDVDQADVQLVINQRLHGEALKRAGNTLEIVSYVHCGLCIRELPHGESPRSYGSLEVGFTPLGLQVWCKRHEANVVHIDFEGVQHPANTSRKGSAGEAAKDD